MMQANQNSSRTAALARRKAMSSGGKSALSNNSDRTRSAPARATAAKVSKPEAAPVATPTAKPASSSVTSYRPRVVANPVMNSSRAASLARRKAMSNKGKSAAMNKDRTRDQSMVASSAKAAVADKTKAEAKGDCGCGCNGNRKESSSGRDVTAPVRAASKGKAKRNAKPKISANPSKAAALARRKAQSVRGKAGISAGGMSEAQTARAANPTLTSRELSQALRQQRSAKGKTCKGDKCRPTGKVRKQPETGAAADQSWKVGVSETARGQSVTGTMVARDKDVTGDEASTCRSVTGTEYMGADVFREFCNTEPSKTPMRTGVSSTGRGNAVTGNKVGRSNKVTGDEPGTCKNVTGTEYVGSGQAEAFCGSSSTKHPTTVMPTGETRKGKTITGDNVGNSDKVTGGEAGANRELTGAQYVRGEQVREIPAKVRQSKTLHGGSVTGTAVGRSEKTTGDEAGSGRQITGDDYVGLEQYEASGTQVQPGDRKVGLSQTFGGQSVSGTMNARSERVTGNEPGTCKAITGTPYFGMENYSACDAPAAQGAAARMQRSTSVMGKKMTGQQPGIGGGMTGAEKGACESVTGTPYVGADQAAQACPATPAEPGSPDFPQAVGETTGWGEFSVTAPSHAAAVDQNTGVTGSRYEKGHITGPFGMATGKVTGTEDARFGSGSVNSSTVNQAVVAEQEQEQGRVKSRITGEGQDAGLRITGDDWERGDHVTGTEGASALSRNPSRRGAMNAMVNKSIGQVENESPAPVSKVTGSSGNYEGGSLITYSGGARG